MNTKKIDVCNLNLDSGRLVFYPGETMKGKLRLEMNRSMDMDLIQIICKGKMEVEWDHKWTDNEGNEHHEEYESKDKIFELKQTVFGNDNREKHPAGEHDYPFSFELPNKLPSSFEGDHGYIRYQLKVKIKKSWKSDLKMKRMFSINQCIDVNEPKFNVGPGDEDQKTLGCLCCASGPLTLSANLNRSAFCGGESILVDATVENNTSRDMDDITAILYQRVEFEAKNKSSGFPNQKNDINKIATLSGGKIKEGDTFKWKKKEMYLPPMVPSTKTKLISVSYFIEVHLDVPMGIDMRFNLPLTIGTIPFLPVYQEAETKENKFKGKCPPKLGLPPVEFLGHDSMKPFQYSQVLKDKPKKLNKDEKEFQDSEYIPLYTFAMPAKEPSGSRSNSPINKSSSVHTQNDTKEPNGSRTNSPMDVNGSQDNMPPIE